MLLEPRERMNPYATILLLAVNAAPWSRKFLIFVVCICSNRCFIYRPENIGDYMGILDSILKAITVPAFNEERLYEIVHQEISNNDIRPGLWTKAYSEAYGDINVANSIYIKFRIETLKKEITEHYNKRLDEEKTLKAKRDAELRMLEANKLEMQKIAPILAKQKSKNNYEVNIILTNLKIKNIIVNNDTIDDLSTKLTWTRNANLSKTTTTYDKAMELAKSYNYKPYGKTDWRIPTKQELCTWIKHAKEYGLDNNINDMLENIGFYNTKLPYNHWVLGGEAVSLKRFYFSDSNESHYVWLVSGKMRNS